MPAKKKYASESAAAYKKRKSLTGTARKTANKKAAMKSRKRY